MPGKAIDSGDVEQPLDAGAMQVDAARPVDAAQQKVVTVLELGHVQSIRDVWLSGDRFLSQDVGGHWILWDVPGHRIIADGQAATKPDEEFVYAPNMRGRTMAIPTANGVELRDTTDAKLLATVRMPAENLSPDGLYVWRQSADFVAALSRTGEMLWGGGLLPGAKVFAAPGEMRVANPASNFAAATVERRRFDGPLERAEFVGNFVSWFGDGDHFLVDGPLLAEGEQQFLGVCDLMGKLVRKIPSPTGLVAAGGFGQWVWVAYPDPTEGGVVAFHNLDATREPLVRAGGPPLGLREGLLLMSRGWVFFDLRGRELVAGDKNVWIPSPVASGDLLSDRWVQADFWRSAVVSPGDGGSRTPTFGVGPVSCLAAAPTGRVAVSTHDDLIRVYDVGADGAHPLIEIPSIAATACALSDDGSVLATIDSGARLRTYRLPGGTLLKFWDKPGRSSSVINLSRDGSRLFHDECMDGGKFSSRVCTSFLTSADGAATFALPVPDSITAYQSVLLSPSGKRAVVGGGTTATVYEEGVQIGTLAAWVLGWLDDTHLVMQQSFGDPSNFASYTFQDHVVDTAGTVVVQGGPDRTRGFTGTTLTPIDELKFFESSLPFRMAKDPSYWPSTEPYITGVWSRADLSRLWTPSLPVTGFAAYAGGRIVYPSDNRVVAELWQ
jgi:hypothetical protein